MASRKLLALLVPVLFFAAGCSDRQSAFPTAPESVAFVQNSCSLGVSDADALAAIAALIAKVDALETAGSLTSGQANALRNHLNNAAKQISAGNYCAAIAQLNALIEQVGNFTNDGTLTPVEAESLTGDATVVLEGPPPTPQVTVDAPSSAAGVYAATGASFGPPPTVGGVAGNLVLVNDGVATDFFGFGSTTDGCTSLVGFPAGAIAIVFRGNCLFTEKVKNAQNAGAVAVIVINNVAGLVSMGGSDPSITIPSAAISQADGATILAGLPATGKVSLTP